MNKQVVVVLGSFLILGFFLNFFWETFHGAFLYERQWADAQEYVLLIFRASLGDVMYLAIIYALGACFWRDVLWVRHFTASKACFTALAGLLAALFIEYKGVYLLGKWSYAETMPTIFGFGVSPLAELAVTGTLVFFISGLLVTIKET